MAILSELSYFDASVYFLFFYKMLLLLFRCKKKYFQGVLVPVNVHAEGCSKSITLHGDAAGV